MGSTRTLVLLALILSVVVAGCAGGQDAGTPSTGGAADDDDAATSAEAATEAADSRSGAEKDVESNGAADDGGIVEARAQPALVKTGEVVLEVDDFDRTRRALEQAVRSRGGYVSDSGVTRHREDNRTWKTGYLVLRVPSGQFSDLLSASREEGTVRSEETRTRDVTDQLVDLEARLENLRAKRDRLRAFYERANSTEDLLAIERELSAVQERIERLSAKQRSLEDRVAYSTLRVEVREPAPTPTPTPTPTPEPAYHEQSLVGAFADSVAQLVVYARAALVIAAYGLPYLLVVGAPLTLAGALVWRRVRR